MKVDSFYCEHKGSFFGKSAKVTALEYSLNIINQNYKDGYKYKCNIDSFVEVKPGCWRKILRFIMRKGKEDVIKIKYKYGIFEKENTEYKNQFEFIEILPISAKHTLSAFANKELQNPYLETGKIAVEDYLTENPNIIPYCDLEIMVKVKPGCIRKIWNIIAGNSYKNKFSYKYFEFNIAQRITSKTIPFSKNSNLIIDIDDL